MSVEKMDIVSAVGPIGDINKVTDAIVKCGCIHTVNAMEDVGRFIKEKGIKDAESIRPYKRVEGFERIREQINEAMEALGIEKAVKKEYLEETVNLEELSKDIALIHKEAVKQKRMLERSEEDLNKVIELDRSIKEVKELKFAISELRNLKFFIFRVGRITGDYYAKLKENIENIPSIIYKVSSDKDCVTLVTFTPKTRQTEADEIFRSLGFEEIIIPERVRGVPEDVIRKLDELIEERKEKISRIRSEIASLRQKHESFIERSFTLVQKYARAQDLNTEAVRTNHSFVISGWIPDSAKKEFMERIEDAGDKLILIPRDEQEIKSIKPPTKLKNNSFARPFEYIVNMYGIPAYSEIDPTSFVAVTYTIMFGAMFGDVGQGGILVAAGLYLSLIKNSYHFGGILTRIGVSSMVFGFLYGSVFGNEEIIKPMLFHPLENVNTVLLAGVVFGIFLSTIGYFFNFFNSAVKKEIEGGVFGENGIVGFALYWTALLCVYGIYKYNKIPVPASLAIGFLAVLILLLVFKEPLARLIEGKRPLHKEQPKDYYVESIFGVVETVMTMLSKTVSFVRIGAFAINHVGLFVAFATLAELVRNRAGGLMVMILGNIIIIGLEGLIVVIQCLRLEFYELFSRFFRGDGIQYDPVRLVYQDGVQKHRNKD